MKALNAMAAVTRTLEEKVGWNRLALALSPLITAVAWTLLRPARDGELDELVGTVQATSSVGRP